MNTHSQMNAETDGDGYAIPGTYAISTVSLGSWKSDGTPVPSVRSAVCDKCGKWASTLAVAVSTRTADDSLVDVRISRRTEVIAYACPSHEDEIVRELTDEHGWCTTRYEPDSLATEVSAANHL